MHFHALAIFLAVSSASCLVVPKATQGFPDTEVEVKGPIRSTWVGVGSTATYPSQAHAGGPVPDASSLFIDVSISPIMKRCPSSQSRRFQPDGRRAPLVLR
ncbi:hypothetical protein F5883DRAFT_540675 [Diaporthe sp. PMI_573]|nr:hypothetical protein F5883DRAFT_540675 [Diaporthaceae sp. PMI_573]